MKKFSMTCSCGDMMEVEAEKLEEAKVKMKSQMSEEAIVKHMMARHPGESFMTKDQIDEMINKNIHEVPSSTPMVS